MEFLQRFQESRIYWCRKIFLENCTPFSIEREFQSSQCICFIRSSHLQLSIVQRRFTIANVITWSQKKGRPDRRTESGGFNFTISKRRVDNFIQLAEEKGVTLRTLSMYSAGKICPKPNHSGSMNTINDVNMELPKVKIVILKMYPRKLEFI